MNYWDLWRSWSIRETQCMREHPPSVLCFISPAHSHAFIIYSRLNPIISISQLSSSLTRQSGSSWRDNLTMRRMTAELWGTRHPRDWVTWPQTCSANTKAGVDDSILTQYYGLYTVYYMRLHNVLDCFNSTK